MRRLRQRDLEASRSYLRELYAQRDLEGFKRHVLATIGSVVPSVSVAVDDQGGGADAWESEPAFSFLTSPR